ncbi:hydrolase [Gordonia phage Leroy]|nr:hydrolase [Gordonia phage Leroy]
MTTSGQSRSGTLMPEFKVGDRVCVPGSKMYGKVGAIGHSHGIDAFVVDLMGPYRGDVHLFFAAELEHID